MSDRFSHEVGEGLHGLVNGVDEILYQWEQRFSSARPGWVERYVKGDANIYVRCRVLNGESQDLYFLVKWQDLGVVREGQVPKRRSVRGWPLTLVTGHREGREPDGDQGQVHRVMFVLDIELMEQRKPVERGVPGRAVIEQGVRLHPCDPVDGIRRHSHYFDMLTQRLVRFGPLGQDGEPSFVSGSVVVRQHQLPGNVFKRGPKAVDAVAKNDADPRGRMLAGFGSNGDTAGLLVCMTSQIARAALKKGIGQGCEIRQVLLGPLDSRAGTVKTVSHELPPGVSE